MKTTKILVAFLVVLTLNISCNAQSEKGGDKTKVSKTQKVEVFYFHYTRRCMTCRIVESESKKIVENLYGKKVSFAAYNLEEPEGEQKGNGLGVTGQTLLIVSGDKKINVTNEGFMYASSNPEKLRQIIKEKIDPLL